MKRLALLFALVVIAATGIWWARHSSPAIKSAPADETKATGATVLVVAAPSAPTQPTLLGESILRDYANPNRSPENDLTLMSHLVDNALLLLKSAANRPLSANEDWADLLRGKNGAGERFLPENHAALNSKGQLVDRWGTPLFFHALGSGRYEIRSAGPDKRLWTTDDVHRNPDGSFRHGSNLNSVTLFPEPHNP